MIHFFFFRLPPHPPRKIKSWHVSSAQYVWLFFFHLLFFRSNKYLYSTVEKYNGKRFARSHNIIAAYKIMFGIAYCNTQTPILYYCCQSIAFPESDFQPISMSDKPDKPYYIIFFFCSTGMLIIDSPAIL